MSRSFIYDRSWPGYDGENGWAATDKSFDGLWQHVSTRQRFSCDVLAFLEKVGPGDEAMAFLTKLLAPFLNDFFKAWNAAAGAAAGAASGAVNALASLGCVVQ